MIKFGFHKTKNYFFFFVNAVQNEKKSTDWERIFAILIFDKWLVSEICKELL